MTYAEELTKRRIAKEEAKRQKQEQKELAKKMAEEEKKRKAKQAEDEKIKKRLAKLKLSIEAKNKERELKKQERKARVQRQREATIIRMKKIDTEDGIKIENTLAGLPPIRIESEDLKDLSLADAKAATRNQMWESWLSRTKLSETLLDFAILLKLRYNNSMNKLCLAWCLPVEDMTAKIDKTYLALADEFIDANKERIEDKLVKVLAGNGSIIKGYKEEDITPDVESLKKLALRRIQESLATETNPAVVARTLDVLEKYEPRTQQVSSGDTASNALDNALAKRYGNINDEI